jgi:hypothetical protein
VIECDVGETNAVFTLRLSAPSERTVQVDFSTVDNTALAGRDFVLTNGVITFDEGVTLQTVRVAVTGNRTIDGNRTFFLNFTNAANGTLPVRRAICTVLDNDSVIAAADKAIAGAKDAVMAPDAFRILSIQTERNEIVFTIQTLARRTAVLEASDQLGPDAQWSPVSGATNVAGNGGVATVRHRESDAQPVRFYRFRLLPQ